MGAGEIISAVADAGPIIHLSEIGCLSFLQLFNAVHIPDAVWSEITAHQKIQENDIKVISNVLRHTLNKDLVFSYINENKLGKLHAGEKECLFLCKQKNISIILTDDMFVRESAKQLCITPVGSLGIIVKAYKLGRISLVEAERQIDSLYTISSLFVTKAIVEIAIKQLHKKE